MYSEIKKCRICGNDDLVPVLDLGIQKLSGVFPKTRGQEITAGPLELVLCSGGSNKDCCGLLQLRHSYDLGEMYGLNYGYRSGLNKSMVNHLHSKVAKIMRLIDLKADDLVVDIGSNDSTTLQAYPSDHKLNLVGVDPTGIKFSEFYPDHIILIADFFSAKLIKSKFGGKKAPIITSFSMFYDLESPLEFMAEVRDLLAKDGLWVLEQSYMPTMLDVNAYDTVCHEHLEYYGLSQIKWMADRVGMKIIDVELNNINGGSFSITMTRDNASLFQTSGKVQELLKMEEDRNLNDASSYVAFRGRVNKHRQELIEFVKNAKAEGEKIVGYGASTKGNIVLQFCGFTENDIPCIAEVNQDKFGCFTPGTNIPIIPESVARAAAPDYFLVLPWHFRDDIVAREKKFLETGGRLLFPLPVIEVVQV